MINSPLSRFWRGLSLGVVVAVLTLSTIWLVPYLAAAQAPPGAETPAAAPTAEFLRGKPGVAGQRATVNFAALARQDSLRPAESGVGAPPFIAPDHFAAPGHDSAPATPVTEPVSLDAITPQASLPSPDPAASFPALEDNGTAIPPDTQGAAGPNHLMVTLNSQIRIQDRSGGVISTVAHENFWASLGPFTSTTGILPIFDPKVLYDPYDQRWIFVALTGGFDPTSAALIGVSQTNDPTGDWHLYRIDADAQDQTWIDYPKLGFSKDWIVLGAQIFKISDASFQEARLYAFDKADLYGGGSGAFTEFSFTDASGVLLAPAVTYDDTLDVLYLLNDHGTSSKANIMHLYALRGPVGAETIQLAAVPGAAGFSWWFSAFCNDAACPADFAPQPGSTQKIQTNFSDVQKLVYRNGSLWAVHTVFPSPSASGPPNRSSIQWWQISPAGIVIQRGLLDDPSGQTYYAFPSLAVNAHNDLLIGYSRFSATQYASANYVFRAASDPPNTLRTEVVLKAGEAPYYKTFGGPKNRWGDYSSTVVDPVNDTDFWTIQEYAATPVEGMDRWGTWWGKIAPPADEAQIFVPLVVKQ